MQKTSTVYLDLVDLEGHVGQRLDLDEARVLDRHLHIDHRLLILHIALDQYIGLTGREFVQPQLVTAQKIVMIRGRGHFYYRIARIE